MNLEKDADRGDFLISFPTGVLASPGGIPGEGAGVFEDPVGIPMNCKKKGDDGTSSSSFHI